MPVVANPAGECAVHCGGFECPAEWHLAILTQQSFLNAEWGSGPHYDFNCYEGLCADEHPWCEPIAPALEDLRLALSRHDLAAVAVLINREDRIQLNVHRSAIQVSSCQGDLAAHLPLSRANAARIQGVVNGLE